MSEMELLYVNILLGWKILLKMVNWLQKSLELINWRVLESKSLRCFFDSRFLIFFYFFYFRTKENFMGLSFPTISGSGPNGSVIHYHPMPETNRPITDKEIYLCDSGAQYL